MKISLLTLTLMLFACAKPDVVRVSPPASYLQLAPLPAIPADNATEKTVVNYLFALHDSALMCRQQIKLIKQWRSHAR